jgi:integrase
VAPDHRESRGARRGARHTAREIQPLTPDQARALIDSVKGHRLAAIVSVATAAGLRLGEALGLRWSDVSFDAGTLSVRQALERSGGDSAARRSPVVQWKALRARLAAPSRFILTRLAEASRSKGGPRSSRACLRVFRPAAHCGETRFRR